MEIQETKIRKLVADEGKIIISKATTIDEETSKEVAKIQAKEIYLGKNDSEENYVEIDKTESEGN